MKYLVIFLSIILSSTITFAEGKTKEIVTEKYTVSGNCGSCKNRIEKAAYIKGVKRAEWDDETKVLVVSYRKDKTSADKILESIADAGHDSEKHTASEEEYAKLPGCCNYRTGSCGENE